MTAKFKPYAAKRLSSLFVKECIVAAPTFMGALVVYERPAMPELGPLGVGVTVLVWHDKNLPGGANPDIAIDGNTTLQVGLTRIKKSMLAHGASAEAVRLIGELSPFTEKELKIMAEKLAGKTPAAKKTPAKAAPAKGKGNPEALKKARDAQAGKREAMRAKRIKPLIKAKDIAAREGTFRHRMLTALLNSKTVGDFYDAATGDDKFDAGCIRFAEGANIISLS